MTHYYQHYPDMMLADQGTINLLHGTENGEDLLRLVVAKTRVMNYL